MALSTADFTYSDPDALQGLANVRIDSLPAAGTGTLRLNGVAVTAGQVVSAADIAAGRLVYTPALNGNGLNYSAFTFSVQDSAGSFDAAPNSVTFNVTPVNDAPVANDDTAAATNEDTPAVIAPATLLGNDTDVDGDTLSIASVQGAVGGTVAIVGGNVVFTPTANFNGPASFTYTVIDGNGGVSTATVNLAVNPVNDNPVANPDAASTPINTLLASIVVLANDTDVDGNTLSVTAASVNPAEGTVSLNADGTLAFTPALNFTGPAVISYSISDGAGGTATSSVTVNVGANNAPLGADAVRSVLEDGSYTVAAGDFGFTDVDAGQSLANVRIDSLPALGKGSIEPERHGCDSRPGGQRG